jgi:hypothetical protein
LGRVGYAADSGGEALAEAQSRKDADGCLSGRDGPGLEELAGGSAVAELVIGERRGVDVTGVKRLGLDGLEVLERGEADRDG